MQNVPQLLDQHLPISGEVEQQLYHDSMLRLMLVLIIQIWEFIIKDTETPYIHIYVHMYIYIILYYILYYIIS